MSRENSTFHEMWANTKTASRGSTTGRSLQESTKVMPSDITRETLTLHRMAVPMNDDRKQLQDNFQKQVKYIATECITSHKPSRRIVHQVRASTQEGAGTFAEFCKPLATWRNFAKVPAPTGAGKAHCKGANWALHSIFTCFSSPENFSKLSSCRTTGKHS